MHVCVMSVMCVFMPGMPACRSRRGFCQKRRRAAALRSAWYAEIGPSRLREEVA